VIHFETFESRGQFYFRLVGANNEIVAASEGYTTKAARDHAIRLIRHGAFEARVKAGKPRH